MTCRSTDTDVTRRLWRRVSRVTAIRAAVNCGAGCHRPDVEELHWASGLREALVHVVGSPTAGGRNQSTTDDFNGCRQRRLGSDGFFLCTVTGRRVVRRWNEAAQQFDKLSSDGVDFYSQLDALLKQFKLQPEQHTNNGK